MAPRKMLAVRIDEEMEERLDILAERMSERIGGAVVPRSNVIREVIRRGVEALEAEYRIRRATRRPKER